MALQEALVDVASGQAPELATPASTASPATVRVKLWDLPLRIFHWSLLAAVTTAIVTGKLGGEWMPVHGKAGITIVGLLAFRVVWGLVGSTPARFAHFVPTPGEILAYLKGRWQGIGHNPLGALSVLALIGVLGVQAGTGLFSNDDIAFTGPLAARVADELSLQLTGWHRQLANVLFVLLGLHIAAILFYVRVKKDKLIKPMVTGWKEVPADLPPRRARGIALIAAVAVGVGLAYLANGAWPQAAGKQAATDSAAQHSSIGASPTAASASTPAW